MQLYQFTVNTGPCAVVDNYNFSLRNSKHDARHLYHCFHFKDKLGQTPRPARLMGHDNDAGMCLNRLEV